MYRRLQGSWRRTTWPAAVLCAPSECGDIYKIGFEAVQAEMQAQNLPAPSQMHLDWCPFSKSAAKQVWGSRSIRFRRGLEHFRRNVLKNQRAGQRKPKKRPAKAKAQSKAAPKRRHRAAETTPPPYMTSRSPWAFLNLLARLTFAPSQSFLHLALEACLDRIRCVWQEPRFAGYIEAEYTELIPVDSNVFGVAALRLGDWWSGPGSGKDYMPHPPSSQQAAEQLNAKFKRDLKATGKLDSHTQVIHAMTEVLNGRRLCQRSIRKARRQ